VEDGSWVEILDGRTFEQTALVDTIETFTPLARFDRSAHLYVFGEDRRGVEIYRSPGFQLDRVVEGITNVGNISPDGSLAVTFDPGGRGLGIYDTETGVAVDHLKDVPGFPKAPVTPGFSPDGRQVAMATNAAATAVWDTGTGEQVFTLSGGPGTNITTSVDGDRLYTGHSDGSFKVWDLRPAGGLPSVDDLGTHHWVNANTFAIGPEIGAAVAIDIGAFDFQMVFFDVQTGSFLGQPIKSWSSPAVALADNRFVLRTTLGEWITYDPMTGEQSYLAGCPTDDTGALCTDTGDTTPDVNFVASVDGTELTVSIDGSPAQFIDPDTGEELGPVEPGLDSIAFMTGDWLAGRTAENEAVIIDRQTGEELHRITLPQRGRAETSTTGSVIALSSDDGQGLTILDTATWNTLAVELDLGLVRGLSASPDGTTVALGDENGLHIVDANEGRLVQSIPLPSVSDIHWLDADTVLIGTTTGVWAKIPLGTDSLISLARTNLTRGFTEGECITYRIDPCPTLDEIRSR
jgi:WD40 repeat protein